MKKIILLALLLPCIGCGKQEPLYHEKTASQWAQALQEPDPQVRREAATALGALKVKKVIGSGVAVKGTSAKL
jgi:predicted small lipoprotein YifL